MTFTSIERLTVTPNNGIVNLIGDNDVAGGNQNDYFKVRGTGQEAFTLQVGGSWKPATGDVGDGVTPNDGLSAPITFTGVTRINASGGAATSFDGSGNAIPDTTDPAGVNALDITPYANNIPQNWGIQTYWNQGNAHIADGGVPNPDLLTFNGVSGVSENIVIQPSADQAGQIYDNNAATNTPIAVVNYTSNTAIIVNGSSPSGTAGDTDTLTLRGTDPANPGTSGNEDVVADFTQVGGPTSMMVRVYDAGATAAAVRQPTAAEVADTSGVLTNILYALQDVTNFSTINIQTLGGNDALSVTGANDGSEHVNVDGGLGTNTLLLPGSSGNDSFVVTPGPSNDSGMVAVTRTAATAATTVSYTNLQDMILDGGGGTGADAITLNGTGDDDTFTATAGGVGATTGRRQSRRRPGHHLPEPRQRHHVADAKRDCRQRFAEPDGGGDGCHPHGHRQRRWQQCADDQRHYREEGQLSVQSNRRPHNLRGYRQRHGRGPTNDRVLQRRGKSAGCRPGHRRRHPHLQRPDGTAGVSQLDYVYARQHGRRGTNRLEPAGPERCRSARSAQFQGISFRRNYFHKRRGQPERFVDYQWHDGQRYLQRQRPRQHDPTGRQRHR